MENNQIDNQPAEKKVNDFSVPQRMSKSAFVVFLYNELKRNVGFFSIIIILNFFNSEKQFTFIEIIGKFFMILGVLILISFLIAFLNFYYKKFYVKDGNLIFMHGIFHRETTSIPVTKLHSMRTKRGPVYRLLDMKGISFDTLALKTEEIELILDDADWEALLNLVESQEEILKERYTATANAEGNGAVNEAEDDETTIQKATMSGNQQHTSFSQNIHFSNLNLIKGALCQNHLKGMTILGSAILLLFGKVSEYSDKAVEYAFDYIENNIPETSFSISAFAIFLACTYLVVMAFWIGNVILRYFNMEVRMDKSHLFFEGGLFTRQSSQFAYDKVCTVYVKQNILEKSTNSCTINLKQAFNATDKKNESDVKIYGSDSANDFLDWWLGKAHSASEEIISAHSGNGLLGFAIKWDIVITATAFIVLGHFEQYSWMIIPALYMILCLVKGVFTVYRSNIILKEDYFIINNGQFASIQNYMKYSNIEVVKLVHTPFTPFFHRVNLIISTNGTSFAVRSLKEHEAYDIYEILLCRCRNESQL